MLVAAAVVPVAGPRQWGRGRRRGPGGLDVVGGRRGHCSGDTQALRPRRWEEEGTVVGVLVEVGVCPPGLGSLGGRVGGGQCQLVSELLHLPRQLLHRVEVVGGDGVGECLRTTHNMVDLY